MKPTQVRIRAIELRAQGLSYANIAKELNIAKQTAVDIVNEKRHEVENLQALEMEALFETQQVNLKGRVEQLAALHSRLKEEIERRDMAEIPTEKLITLYLKTTEALKEEVYTPMIKSTDVMDYEKATTWNL